MNRIIIPLSYDYIGVYLTDKCHLRCEYCITKHHQSSFGESRVHGLSSCEWIRGLNRLVLPSGVPITLQGGEPFLYKGIWEILAQVHQKIDILTALPPHVSKESFLKLPSLDWNKRAAPYPTIRVSYHKGQNNFMELVSRVSELQEVVSIGIYYLEHPAYKPEEIVEMKQIAKEKGVELRSKEYLGVYAGKTYGSYLYPDAITGVPYHGKVRCKNTVVPIGPDGMIYRCHSDLYFMRTEQAIGSIIDEQVVIDGLYKECNFYGLCSECDVKVKTNHKQEYGYTSVTILKEIEVSEHEKR